MPKFLTCSSPDPALLLDPRFFGVSSLVGDDGDAGATQVDEGDERSGGVKPQAAVAEQADLAVQAFEADVGETEGAGCRDAPSRWPRTVRARRKKGCSWERWAQASQASRCAGALAGSSR